MKALRVLIVGGVAGGATAAARLRRLHEAANIIMFERGEHISYANCGLPYHIEGKIEKRESLLLMTPQKSKDILNVDVRTFEEVLSIDRDNKLINIKKLKTGEEYQEKYDKLILSPGASPFVPPMDGLESVPYYTLRNVQDMDIIIKQLKDVQPSKAVVVGGGFIGLELAQALQTRGVQTTIIELLTQVMPPIDPEMAAMVHEQLQKNGVQLALGKLVEKWEKGEGKTIICHMSDGSIIETELAVLAVGVRAETKLAKEAQLELGVTQAVKVDEQMRTNDPDIYAVGDVVQHNMFITNTEGYVPLAGPANRQARIAADHICGKDVAYRGTQGTAVCKVFDMCIGSVGLNERSLNAMKIPFQSVMFHARHHASYYPGSQLMTMKVLFDQQGKIYGFQAGGKEGIDKRIDVMATAIRGGMTVQDLCHLELSYAPPYGQANDALNICGFVCTNILNGDLKLCSFEEIDNPTENQFILDLRTKTRFEQGNIANSVNIPLNQLRYRMSELPKDKEILVYCVIGNQSWKAYRLLVQNGFNVKNYAGGYTIYRVIKNFTNV